jgi:hypothetical protein
MKGKITLSRVTSNVEDDYIRIELTDELSGCMFVTGEIGLREFPVRS